jgi:hypothetical protein
MVRYAKKNQYDGMEDMKLHRFQRKFRGHKLAVGVGAARQERRHGWGYVKRRSVALGEE